MKKIKVKSKKAKVKQLLKRSLDGLRLCVLPAFGATAQAAGTNQFECTSGETVTGGFQADTPYSEYGGFRTREAIATGASVSFGGGILPASARRGENREKNFSAD